MRTFVAIFPPPEVQRELYRVVKGLPVDGEVRWTRPENIHLTLKFLGDVPEEDLDEIGDALETVSERHEPFGIAPSGFGAFPSARRAKVLWAGASDGAERMRALAEDVEESLERLGFERERRGFRPHFTLGRARGRPVRMETEEHASSSVSRFVARSLRLMQSAMGEGGVRYYTLAEYPFSEG